MLPIFFIWYRPNLAISDTKLAGSTRAIWDAHPIFAGDEAVVTRIKPAISEEIFSSFGAHRQKHSPCPPPADKIHGISAE
jgi:hypothetical protein